MSEFKLPSGRVVQLKDDITYLEEIDIAEAARQGSAAYIRKAFEVITGETDFSRKDGRALADRVNEIVRGRPEEKEVPFDTASSPSSRVLSLQSRKR